MRTVTETRSPWARLAALSLTLLLLALACQDASADPVGGETHFLSVCDASAPADTCGEGLTCLCDVCTVACDAAHACPALAGVACVGTGAACSAAPAGVCDMSCVDDSDCLALSGAHVCEQGVCRAGGPTGSSVDALECEAASVSADRVLLIGDNLFAGPNDVSAPLVASARSAGILQPDAEFENDAAATNDALAYMGAGIADQYAAGNPDDSARLVIMTGGGVDAVFGTCAELTAECPVLVAAADAAAALLQQMASDGVGNVVYVFYPDAGDPDQKARVDLLRTLVQPVCAEAVVPCHWLDLRAVFDGHYDEYVIAEQGLSAQGAAATADAIWGLVGACLAP